MTKTQKDLPLRQRDMQLTKVEQDLISTHYGLIRAVSYRFRSARIPDLESELSLHACRIVPSYTRSVGAFGPWLQACLSRYVLNLIRNHRKYQRESTETDQCAGGVNDILTRIQSRESQPDDVLTESEAVIESWGDQSTATTPPQEPKPEADPNRERRRANARAMRWVSKHASLLGQWRGLQWYASLAGVPVSSMRRALKLKGYSQPLIKKTKPKTVQPSLFQEA
jgi:DNA-directed RNA polymerase specialized sigma24 family protein